MTYCKRNRRIIGYRQMRKRIYLTVDTECHDIHKLNEYITGETKKWHFWAGKSFAIRARTWYSDKCVFGHSGVSQIWR